MAARSIHEFDTMLLHALIAQLLTPPGVVVLMLAVAWLIRRRWPRASAGALLLAIATLWLCSAPVAVQWAAAKFEQEPALDGCRWHELNTDADAIVVLGASRQGQDPGWGTEQPGIAAIERLRYAARLARASGLPVLLTGGAPMTSGPSETQLMQQVLEQDFGIQATWLEHESRTTWENALYSAEILKSHGIKRVVLVTQAWHMPRARWSFERVGLEVITAPLGTLSAAPAYPLGGRVPQAGALFNSSILAREIIGLIGYRLRYR